MGNPLFLCGVQPLASLLLFVALCFHSPRLVQPANTVITPKNSAALSQEEGGTSPQAGGLFWGPLVVRLDTPTPSCAEISTTRCGTGWGGACSVSKCLSVRIPRHGPHMRFTNCCARILKAHSNYSQRLSSLAERKCSQTRSTPGGVYEPCCSLVTESRVCVPLP